MGCSMNEKVRIVVALFAGMLVLFSSVKCMYFLGEVTGVEIYTRFDEPITVGPGAYDWEESGSLSLVGLIGAVIGWLVSVRVGMAIFYRDIRGGVSAERNAKFIAWLMGLLAFLVFSVLEAMALAPLELETGIISFVRILLQVAAASSIWWALRQWYRNALQRIAEDVQRRQERINKMKTVMSEEGVSAEQAAAKLKARGEW